MHLKRQAFEILVFYMARGIVGRMLWLIYIELDSVHSFIDWPPDKMISLRMTEFIEQSDIEVL